MEDSGAHIAARLRRLTSELRLLSRDLGSWKHSDGAGLPEFREAVDDVRLTAWTVDELNKAKPDRQKALASFLAAERVRRFAQMVRDVALNVEHQDMNWESGGVQTLFDAVNALQAQLEKLVREHRAAFRDFKDERR